jgi:lycopene beta-cyclase
LFSENLLPEQEYEDAIKNYLTNNLKARHYEVTEKERGNIPMTCYDFKEHHTPNVRYIGMAGGWAKPSTGYTFMSSSKKIPILVDHIKSGKSLDSLSFKNKFWYYDLLLLDILKRNNALGGPIFESLFKRRSPQLVFKMLDEETSFIEDLRFISAPKPWPFTKAALRRIFGLS